MSETFGEYLRSTREARAAADPEFSLRRVADRIDIEPSYLSKIERDIEPPPGEETIKDIARDLSLNSDVMLGLAGKVSSDVHEVICKRPALFAELIRTFRSLPDHAVVRVVREVRDGDW